MIVRMGLLVCCVMQSAWGDVYSYVDDNGTTHLSNFKSGLRHEIVVASETRVPGDMPGIKTLGPVTNRMAGKADYDGVVAQVAQTYGLESALLHAVISVESRYNPVAVSRKGAAGMMQLMPDTARRYGVADAFNPAQNIEGGARYLRDLLTMFNSDVGLALAAYNAGENAVLKYGNRIPPYRETKDYVPRVLGFYRKYQSSL